MTRWDDPVEPEVWGKGPKKPRNPKKPKDLLYTPEEVKRLLELKERQERKNNGR